MFCSKDMLYSISMDIIKIEAEIYPLHSRLTITTYCGIQSWNIVLFGRGEPKFDSHTSVLWFSIPKRFFAVKISRPKYFVCSTFRRDTLSFFSGPSSFYLSHHPRGHAVPCWLLFYVHRIATVLERAKANRGGRNNGGICF
jgi:hypothetical protein